MNGAMGIIETKGMITTITAADAALKAADVTLVRYESVRGGLVTVVLVGEVDAVQAAVERGVQAGRQVGRIYNWLVIPRPYEEIYQLMKPAPPVKAIVQSAVKNDGAIREATAKTETSVDSLQRMNVQELRKLARRCEGFPLTGQEISNTTRKMLLEAFQQFQQSVSERSE